MTTSPTVAWSGVLLFCSVIDVVPVFATRGERTRIDELSRATAPVCRMGSTVGSTFSLG